MSQQSTSVNANSHKTSLNRQLQELNPTDSTPIYRQSEEADFHQSRYRYPGPRHPSSSRVQQKRPQFSYSCPYKHSQSVYSCPYKQPQCAYSYAYQQPGSAYSYAYQQPESAYSYDYVQPLYPSSYAYVQPLYPSSYAYIQPLYPSSYDYQQPQHQPSYTYQQPQFPSSYAYQQPQFPCSCPHSRYTDAPFPPPTGYFGAPPTTTFDGRSQPGQPYKGASYIPPDAEHSKQHPEMQKQAAHLREELDDLKHRFSSLKAHLDSTMDRFMGPGSTPIEQKSERGETTKRVSAATISNVTQEPAELQSMLMKADAEVSSLSAQFDSNMEMSLGASTEKEEMWTEI